MAKKPISNNQTCMTPKDIEAKYLETHNADGSLKKTEPQPELAVEQTPEEKMESSPQQIDLEQLKKDVDSALKTLIDVKAVLDQLVVME